MLKFISILPLTPTIDLFGKEKARLRKEGELIEDFDLLIGLTAIVDNTILVTNNRKHFERIEEIKIEDWTNR